MCRVTHLVCLFLARPAVALVAADIRQSRAVIVVAWRAAASGTTAVPDGVALLIAVDIQPPPTRL